MAEEKNRIYKKQIKDIDRRGLVLEGGGMRGIYTAGVLDVWMEQGICFDGVIGVSAGAIHGASFVSGQKGRSIRYYKKYCQDPRFMSWRNLLKTGDIVGRKFCYEDLPNRLDPYDYEAFEQSETEFYVTCSNVETGKAEYLPVTDMKNQVELFRATASLPYVSRIVNTEGRKLLDGGCTDSIPVQAFMNMGYTRCVAVLTRHDGYVKKPEHKWLPQLFFRKYPAFAEALKNRHLVYNQTVEDIRKMEKEGKIFVVRPSRELTIGRMEHSPEKLQTVYEIGRQDAAASLSALERWLVKKCD
ncbi:MAG: patatin-like phospholipase family protein [Clostridium sp.]